MAYDPPLERAIKAAGGVSALAAHLGIGASAVANWSKLPTRHIPRVEALTGIAGRELRPDIYPDPTPARQDAA